MTTTPFYTAPDAAAYKKLIDGATKEQKEAVADQLIVSLAALIGAIKLDFANGHIRQTINALQGPAQPSRPVGKESPYRDIVNLALDLNLIKRQTATDILATLNKIKTTTGVAAIDITGKTWQEWFSPSRTIRSMLSQRVREIYDLLDKEESGTVFPQAVSDIIPLTRNTKYKEDLETVGNLLRAGGYATKVRTVVAAIKKSSTEDPIETVPGRDNAPVEQLAFHDKAAWQFDKALDNGDVDGAVSAVKKYFTQGIHNETMASNDLTADIRGSVTGRGYPYKNKARAEKTLKEVSDTLFNEPGKGWARAISHLLNADVRAQPDQDYAETKARILKTANKDDLDQFTRWILALTLQTSPQGAGRARFVNDVVEIYSKAREANKGVLDNLYAGAMRHVLTSSEWEKAGDATEEAGVSNAKKLIKEAEAGRMTAKTFSATFKSSKRGMFLVNISDQNPGRNFEIQMGKLADSGKAGAQEIYNYMSQVRRVSGGMPKNLPFPDPCNLFFNNKQVRGVWWEAVANINKHLGWDRARAILDRVYDLAHLMEKTPLWKEFWEIGTEIGEREKLDVPLYLSSKRRAALTAIAAATPIKTIETTNSGGSAKTGPEALAAAMSSGKVDVLDAAMVPKNLPDGYAELVALIEPKDKATAVKTLQAWLLDKKYNSLRLEETELWFDVLQSLGGNSYIDDLDIESLIDAWKNTPGDRLVRKMFQTVIGEWVSRSAWIGKKNPGLAKKMVDLVYGIGGGTGNIDGSGIDIDELNQAVEKLGPSKEDLERLDLADMDHGTKLNTVFIRTIDEALKTGKAPELDKETVFKFPDGVDVGSIYPSMIWNVLYGYSMDDVNKFLRILANATNRHALLVGSYMNDILAPERFDRIPKLEPLVKAKYNRAAVGNSKTSLTFCWWVAVKQMVEKNPNSLKEVAKEINALSAQDRESVLADLDIPEDKASRRSWYDFRKGMLVSEFKEIVAEALSADRREKLAAVATQTRREEPERRRM